MGYPVIYLSPNSNGNITAATLESTITPQTLLVSVMMSNNEIGTIQPIKQLAEIAHKNGAIFHTDAVQCVGHLPIDVKDLDVDMLSASAHKFNGPKGIGFLYIKRGIQIPPLLSGGSQEKEKRAGTENIASIVGMAVALKKNCTELLNNANYISELESALLSSLNNAGLVFQRNGCGETIPGNLSLSFPGFEGEAILHRLDLMGIQISTGSACDSVNTHVSHVLQAIGVDEKLAVGTIRISLGKENTEEDVATISEALRKIIKSKESSPI
jgi:cysteine desulfurase